MSSHTDNIRLPFGLSWLVFFESFCFLVICIHFEVVVISLDSSDMDSNNNKKCKAYNFGPT